MNKPNKEAHTPAWLMWREGLLHLEAARRLTPSDNTHYFRSPTLQLAAHSIELALKSYLRAHNRTLDQMRDDYGHNLTKLRDACEDLGLAPLTHEFERACFDFMSKAHADQEFRYVHLDHPPHVHCDEWKMFAGWALRSASAAVAATEKGPQGLHAAMLRQLDKVLAYSPIEPAAETA